MATVEQAPPASTNQTPQVANSKASAHPASSKHQHDDNDTNTTPTTKQNLQPEHAKTMDQKIRKKRFFVSH